VCKLKNHLNWFLNSNIFNKEAYISHYSLFKKGNIYPEITAYAINLSCILYKRYKDNRYLERAQTCANFLIRINQEGGLPCYSDNLLYSFDTGIFISSMFDLFNITKNIIYLKEAKKSLDWLFSQWNGITFPSVNKLPSDAKWYHLPSVHLVKLVIPLLKAYKQFNENIYKEISLQLLDTYKKMLTKNGGFLVNDNSNYIMTHPHCYATEGLLYAYYTFKDQELLEVTKKSVEWLCERQNNDGSFYKSYYIFESGKNLVHKKIKISDATAQAIRLWKLMGVNRTGIEKANNYLLGEIRNGGLMLTKKPSINFSSWNNSIFSWPTFFYIHSLLLPFDNMEFCNELF
jgi:hypothetical protein